jgi:hypothetical protein
MLRPQMRLGYVSNARQVLDGVVATVSGVKVSE